MKIQNIQVDEVICLCCPQKRLDNILALLKQANCLDIKVTLFRVGEDYKDDPNLSSWANCAKCHEAIIQKCLDNNYQNVILLEDDICFTNDFWNILTTIDIPENFLQLQLGGYVEDSYQSYPTHKPEFRQVRYSSGLYGSLLNNRAFIPLMNNYKFNLDYPRQNESCPVDKRTEMELPEWGKYWLTKPVIVERDIVSIIDGRNAPRGQYQQAVKEGRIFYV